MLMPPFPGRGWRLTLALGLDLGTADARLQLQQLQLLVAELFAARPVLRNPLLTQPLFQHPDLQLRVLQTLFRRTQLPFQLFNNLGVGSKRRNRWSGPCRGMKSRTHNAYRIPVTAVDRQALCAVFMRRSVACVVPQQPVCDTTVAVASVPDRFPPAARQTARDSIPLCRASRWIQASENTLFPIACYIPINHFHPRTPTSCGCVARWQTETHARSTGHTATGRAPSHTTPRNPCACRWLPPPDRSVSPRQSRTPLTASPAQSPIAPASLHQNPCPLRSFASGKELPPGHYSCPVLVTDSPRSVPLRPEHRRQHLRSQLPFVSSDNDSEYSALLRACGKTRSPPSRSQQTLPPSAGSPMHCDADAAPEPALRSCQHFTTTARNKTGALLSRLRGS